MHCRTAASEVSARLQLTRRTCATLSNPLLRVEPSTVTHLVQPECEAANRPAYDGATGSTLQGTTRRGPNARQMTSRAEIDPVARIIPHLSASFGTAAGLPGERDRAQRSSCPNLTAPSR